MLPVVIALASSVRTSTYGTLLSGNVVAPDQAEKSPFMFCTDLLCVQQYGHVYHHTILFIVQFTPQLCETCGWLIPTNLAPTKWDEYKCTLIVGFVGRPSILYCISRKTTHRHGRISKPDFSTTRRRCKVQAMRLRKHLHENIRTQFVTFRGFH